MKKLLSRITIALLVTLYACYPVHVMAEGRYQGIKADDQWLWIVDTKTGKSKLCWKKFGNAHAIKIPPRCGPWSVDEK